MQRPNPEAITLNDILMTGELSRRVSRAPNLQAENQAMRMLIHQMAQDSETLMQTLVDTALKLCEAGTAGLSLLEITPEGKEIFRWTALAGTLAHHVGGSTPRNFSPCGVCLDQGSPVLFSHPERYFTYFQEASTPIVEGLVLPLVADQHIFGTIWIVSHDEQRQVGSEDVRIMTSLADLTATALLLQQRQTRELLAANAALEVEVAERQQAEEQARALISNLPGGAAFVVDRNLRYLLAEGEALAKAGFKPEDFVGRTIFEILPPELTTKYEPNYHKALAGEPFEVEHAAHDRTYVSRGTPLYAANGEAYAVLVISYDITDRKHAEEKLRRAAEIDAFRVQLSDALRSLTDSGEIQAEACRILGEHLGVDRAYYVEVNEVEDYAQVNQNYLHSDSPSLVGRFGLVDYGWILPHLRRGKTIVVTNADNADMIPEAERVAMKVVRIAAHITIPLVKAGVLVGALCVTESEPRQWLETEVELVRETAERIWAAVERARVEAALRQFELQRVQEQSALEQEHQRAETLAELDRAKTLFFSNISHEFRTPLTLSLAPLQEVLKKVDEWEQGSKEDGEHTDNPLTHQPIVLSTLKHNLQLVHRNHLRLLKLVNTLLDFSQIEAGRMEAAYIPTDLATFTTELTSVFRSAIERAGLRLLVDCPPLPEPVYVDREMWEKIVLNLLSNALKFTFEGEIRVRLSLGTGEMESKGDGEMGRRTSTPQAMLEICDTGVGIASEHLPHLFERFYQVRGTQARTDEGSGIGLALVHELVQFHGGTIDVSSTVGKGTCFTIALPFGTDHLPSDRLQLKDNHHPIRTLASTAISPNAYLQEAERWLPSKDFGLLILDFGLDSSDTTASPDRNLDQLTNHPKSTIVRLSAHAEVQNPKSKILLVDDNADMREYLTRILSGYVQVKAVADGATALKVAQEQVPDLILSDVMMPGLDGFELLRALRADPRTQEIPIILLSARAGEKAIVEELEAGADDYWIKPFSAQELISRVTAHLQMAQLRGAALQQERIMNRHKDEFISVISHELNTPLASILGWTRMLRSSPFNPAMLSKALDIIERNATLQGNLIQDLLDLSRITAGKLRLHLQPIELKPVIETAIATVIQPATDKDIHLTWQDNNLSPIVMGDSYRLSQVLINLLSNAIKFTPESGNVWIELSAMNDASSANSSYAEIRVMDTGIGIAADFLRHVFGRFRQAEDAHATKGLGLGLTIARHIVELHNGFIRAESPGEGQGATLIVELPLVQ